VNHQSAENRPSLIEMQYPKYDSSPLLIRAISILSQINPSAPMKNLLIRTAMLALITLTAGWLPAQVPQLISYQGRVGVDGVNFDGSGQFKFAFVNAAATTTYWSNDGSSTGGSEPSTAISIPVSKGLYSVLLGDATLDHMSIVPATVFTHGDVHLRVWFSDGVNGFQQLTPDRRIAAVGYAMMADSVSDGAITTAKIADGAVTSAKLAEGVVQTANLATGAVGNAQLANSTVTINAGTGLGGGGLVSLGGNVTLSNAGVLSLTGGGGISVDAATGAITLGSSATSAGTAGAIVARDASGGFTAGTITAALNGNAATSTSATSFTGPLTGDVTGTQAATTIADATVTGKVLTGFTSASGSVTASDTLLSAISKLDGNTALKAPLASPTFTGSVTLPAGSATAAPLLLQTGTSLTTPTFGALEFDGTNVFVTNNSASPTRKTVAFTDSTIAAAQITDGTITSAKLTSNLTLGGTTSGTFSGNLTGNVSGNVSGSAASFTGSLTGDVTGTQAATVVSTVGGITSTSLAAGATLANAATSANTGSNLVRRDASGDFSAGTITGNLAGNATTATNATNFTGMLAGDVTGTQSATVVSSLGGLSAANIASGATLSNSATSASTASTLVKRDASGNFSAGTITAALNGNASTATNATSFTGALAGDVTGTQGATVVSTVGTSSAANINAAELAANAATSANMPGTIMKRDTNGGLSAGTITSVGNLSLSTTNALGTVGVINLGGSRLIHSFGSGNFFAGTNSGNFSMTGVNNTSVGSASLSSNTLGSSNTGIGSLALNQNTTGLNNTAQGFMALQSNTTGNNNTGIGQQSLQFNTTGNQNTSIGISSLQNNSTGGANTAVGALAMSQGVSGSSNTAVGWKALTANASGGNNVAVGSQALLNLTLGNSNIAIGPGAGSALTTGNDNIIVGNAGVAGETGIIRIGTSGIHTNTYLAGVINGDGSGLTGLTPKVDRQGGTGSASGSATTSFRDLISLTTHDLGEPGCYTIMFVANITGANSTAIIVLNVNGVDVQSTTQSGNFEIRWNFVVNSIPNGALIKVRYRNYYDTGGPINITQAYLNFDGIPQSYIR
jgi:hypothetical protein